MEDADEETSIIESDEEIDKIVFTSFTVVLYKKRYY